jgi:hypothetical protein
VERIGRKQEGVAELALGTKDWKKRRVFRVFEVDIILAPLGPGAQ